MGVANILNVSLAIISFVGSFYSVGRLMLFLSDPTKLNDSDHSFNKNENLFDATYSLLINLALLSLFMIQHSLMARPYYTRFIESLGLKVAERSIFNITTSIVLYALVKYWKPVSYFNIWSPDIFRTVPAYWVILFVHFIAWSIIYGGSLLMDIPEILGVKQVYYDVQGLNPPMSYKSSELNKLYSHMRHPSFTALTTIFWFVPILSLDRLLLALLWTTYMMMAWRTDKDDIEYQHGQRLRKEYELNRVLK